MKKYKISVLLVIILCFTILPSYSSTSGAENIVETKKAIKDKALEKQKEIWAELFNTLIKIESDRLYDINNNVIAIKEKKEDTFSFLPEYVNSYGQPSCGGQQLNFGISYMYAVMLGHCSWSGEVSGCQETGACGGGGDDCGSEGGPCEF